MLLHPADLLWCSLAHYLTPSMFVCSLFWGVGHFSLNMQCQRISQDVNREGKGSGSYEHARAVEAELFACPLHRWQKQLQGTGWQLSSHMNIAFACQKMHLSSWIPLERLRGFPSAYQLSL